MSTRISRRAFLATTACAVGALPAAANDSIVEESGFVSLGGIDQWVSVRGADRRNPILLFLHGGPAAAQSPFLSLYRSWERDFTVVHWDQRGAGRTFGRNGKNTSGMTLERMADDAGELAAHLGSRLDSSSLVLVGHSWGSLLGLAAMQRRPEVFTAFVGTGQMASSWDDLTAAQYAFARGAAQAAGDKEATEALAAIDPPNARDRTHLNVVRRWLARYLPDSDKAYLKIQDDFAGRPPYPAEGERAEWIGGQAFSGAKLLPILMSSPINHLERGLRRPFFIIQGREDHITPTEAAKIYLAGVHAPRRGFAEIDGGHFAAMSNPEGFLTALNGLVRPMLDKG